MIQASEKQVLLNFFKLYSIDSEPLLTNLGQYISELELWNPKLGLVETDRADWILRHILDCLIAVPYLKEKSKTVTNLSTAADIGSGAGLPGLLLAAAFPEMVWTLVEKQGRRCSFLMNAAAKMGLKNVHVLQTDLVDLKKESFSLITARAFKPISQPIFDLLAAPLTKDGMLLLYKGKLSRIHEELASLDVESRTLAQVQEIRVPDLDEERHLVWFRKI